MRAMSHCHWVFQWRHCEMCALDVLWWGDPLGHQARPSVHATRCVTDGRVGLIGDVCVWRERDSESEVPRGESARGRPGCVRCGETSDHDQRERDGEK